MKALILAAGFGTRLLPYTKVTPKPLFQINGQPLLDITIRQLIKAGCSDIIINTHHLHQQIESCISKKNYPIPVRTRYEPEILDTGGAIKNVQDFWDDEPFFVVNSDIVTDINYKKIYQFHLSHKCQATLVLHDYPEFNVVAVDSDNFIKGFYLNNPYNHASQQSMKVSPPRSKNLVDFHINSSLQKLAFTGIQVLNPEILDLIPEGKSTSSIDIYKALIKKGPNVKAFITQDTYWIDIGTPEKYSTACINAAAPLVFKTETAVKPLITKLKGDGSDRKWYRLEYNGNSIILGDHGITNNFNDKNEIESFISIGRHLFDSGIPVPEIYHYDLFPGHVYMEDLGNTDLEQTINQAKNVDSILFHYKKILKLLVQLSVKAGKNFDLSWTYQTRHYDKKLIIQNECNYFINAFVNPFTKDKINADDLWEEFAELADQALKYPVQGFMHRDFQSKNIMVKNNNYYFIDFQGGRSGPVQYDLASLLIDPYVKLDDKTQTKLTDYFITELSKEKNFNAEEFMLSYIHLKITRNLQMLGAFGFLSRIKGKTYFEKYIPTAVKTLKKNIKDTDTNHFKKLKKLIAKI